MRLKVYGVGINDCPGWTSAKNRRSVEYRIYDLWRSMLCRCYSELYLNKRPTYLGCQVSDSWLYLSNFSEDIKKLNGYNAWLQNDEKMVFDKDINAGGRGKMYSPEFCQFISLRRSTAEMLCRNPHISYSGLNASRKVHARPVKAIDSEGNTNIFSSQREAARILGIDHTNISHVLLGKQNNTKGYTFQRI